MVIMAGPNGAGKSTVAAFLLSNQSINRFVNADIIARGMSLHELENAQIGAGRVMLKELHEAIDRRQNIAFETTLSGRSWRRVITMAKKYGYDITICFVALESAELAKARVAARVHLGGHAIPDETISRRFSRSILLFFSEYQDLADNWYFFDNSNRSAILLASFERGCGLRIYMSERYDYYKKMALRGS